TNRSPSRCRDPLLLRRPADSSSRRSWGPLFRKVVGDVHRHLVHFRSMTVTQVVRSVVSTLTPSGSGIKAFDHGAFEPAFANAKRGFRGCRTVAAAAVNSLIIPDQNPVHEESTGIE